MNCVSERYKICEPVFCFLLTLFLFLLLPVCVGEAKSEEGATSTAKEKERDMHYQVRQQATMGVYGGIRTDSPCYKPLETVTVRVTGRDTGDERCRILVCDPLQRPYHEAEFDLEDNHGETTFPAAGALGNHYIYLYWPDKERHSRYLNFWLDCETSVRTGDEDFDLLYPFTRDHMRLGRREYDTPQGKFVGYMSADTWHFDGIWLRDWIYGLPGYKHWEPYPVCGIDRFLEAQTEQGMIPDGIERNGRTWRVGLESDVEYIMVLGAWGTWKITGDHKWLEGVLPKLAKCLDYVQSDEKHWDPERQLIKRQHSCDTWDFDIDGAGDAGNQRFVVATCDQSGYYLAFKAMAEMSGALGLEQESESWEEKAEGYRTRADELLWDGMKYLHHYHLDPIDHDGFDESKQLAMGNTWAITRGLAGTEKGGCIVDEYKKRQEETGDAYPWWSLQPGYPDELEYFGGAHRKQGGYANGGLMPWVGGELCRGAFMVGREGYGVQLLRQYAEHLRRTGGAHVWYWPNGEPGFRTTNEVPYAGWGMAEWLNALMEGLAGIRDDQCRLEKVTVSPRWSVAGVQEADIVFRYAASKGYFAYNYRYSPVSQTLDIEFSGSGQEAVFNILLPEGFQAKEVLVNAKPAEHKTREIHRSRYCEITTDINGPGRIAIGLS